VHSVLENCIYLLSLDSGYLPGSGDEYGLSCYGSNDCYATRGSECSHQDDVALSCVGTYT